MLPAESAAGAILLADDEPLVRDTTAELLRRDGYRCVTVEDGFAAHTAARDERFDLLIADLEMPGNEELALVGAIAAAPHALPVIILTGFPSVQSAAASIELPVAAYLTKPVPYEELRPRVDAAVTRSRAIRQLQDAEARLEAWRRDLDLVATVRGYGAATVDVFLSLALRNVIGGLTDVEQLGRALARRTGDAHPCQVLNCPRGLQLERAVREAIAVIDETRHAFKSRQLAELRTRLEQLVAPS